MASELSRQPIPITTHPLSKGWAKFELKGGIGEAYVKPQTHEAGAAYLFGLFVKPDMRGRGLGRSLFNAQVDFAKSAGYNVLHTTAANEQIPKYFDRFDHKDIFISLRNEERRESILTDMSIVEAIAYLKLGRQSEPALEYPTDELQKTRLQITALL